MVTCIVDGGKHEQRQTQLSTRARLYSLDTENLNRKVALTCDVGRHVHLTLHAERIVPTKLQFSSSIIAHMQKKSGQRGPVALG